MNSNATSHTGITPSECQIYTFLGGKPDQTSTAAYAVHVLITVLSSIACPFTTVLNLLVIISVKRKAQLKTISNTVLGCLAGWMYRDLNMITFKGARLVGLCI